MTAIHFNQITREYVTSKPVGFSRVLDNVDFAIQEGEFFGLLGPNGAGKTTLISILSGLLRPTKGQTFVMGHNVQTDGLTAKRNLGVVPQEIVFDPFFSVYEILKFQAGYYGIRDHEWITTLLDRLGLAEKTHANMRTLSGGMKRRVMIALALVHRPPVIVLDEPTAGVDIELRQTLWQFISELNQQGHTILLTTHYLEEAEALCDRIAVMNRGQLLALDQTSHLINSISSSILSFKTSDTLPESLQQRAKITGRIVHLTINDPEDVERYLHLARQARVTMEDIEVRKADLSEVFSRIVKKQNPHTESEGNLL